MKNTELYATATRVERRIVRWQIVCVDGVWVAHTENHVTDPHETREDLIWSLEMCAWNDLLPRCSFCESDICKCETAEPEEN